jgi:hypothetical protein
MGYSSPSTFFCNKTIYTVSNEAKENIKKSLEYLGLTRIGALVSAFLIFSKEFLDSTVHFTSFPFLSMVVICFSN